MSQSSEIDPDRLENIEIDSMLDSASDIWVSKHPYWRKRKRNYIVDRLIQKDSINFIYGKPGAAKSLIAIDLVCNLQENGYWANRTTKECIVYYFAYEDPDGVLDRLTISSIIKRYQREGAIATLSLLVDPPDIFDPKTVKAMERQVEDRGQFGDFVIVIDTLNAATPGMNENDGVEMGKFLDVLRKLRNVGCTIIVVHHTGKDVQKGMRGHNSHEALADSIFFVEKRQNSNVVKMTRTKDRNGPGGEKFIFELHTGTIEYDPSEQIPYLEFKDESDASTPAEKPTVRQVKVLNITEELLKTDPVNIRTVFGLQTDLLAIQLSQIEEVFIAKAIAPQAKSKASQRKAVKRVLDSLVQKEMVHQQDGFYWLPDLDQTGSDTAEQ